jgi:hypothetical protein
MPLPITTTSVSVSMLLAGAAAGGCSRVAEQLVCRETLRRLLTALPEAAHWLVLIVRAHGRKSRLLAPVWVGTDCSWAEQATLIPPTSRLDRGFVGQSTDTVAGRGAVKGEEACAASPRQVAPPFAAPLVQSAVASPQPFSADNWNFRSWFTSIENFTAFRQHV